MAFLSLQGDNIATKERLQTSTNESDLVHASPVILQTYDSRSTVSRCPENNSHSARCTKIHERPQTGLGKCKRIRQTSYGSDPIEEHGAS